jgi:hypothetical protein
MGFILLFLPFNPLLIIDILPQIVHGVYVEKLVAVHGSKHLVTIKLELITLYDFLYDVLVLGRYLVMQEVAVECEENYEGPDEVVAES